MRHPRIIIASIGLAQRPPSAAVSPPPRQLSRNQQPTICQPERGGWRTHPQATVAGKTETILVNSQGLPLYYYLSDTRRGRWSPAGWRRCGRR